MLAGVLDGSTSFVVTRDDIAKQRLDKGSSPRAPTVRRVRLSTGPGRAVWASTAVFDGAPVPTKRAVEFAELRKGVIPVRYQKVRTYRTLIVTLTDDARARLNVWLDSMEERGLVD